jgi:hypothetical protein
MNCEIAHWLALQHRDSMGAFLSYTGELEELKAEEDSQTGTGKKE